MLAGAALAALPAAAQQQFPQISMFIPAGPGGGWDGLGRAIERVARAANLAGTFQFENVGGAGGMVGLPRFVNRPAAQRPYSLMVGGSVMVGAALTNRSPVGIQNVTPIARMTIDDGIIVVPASSPHQTIRSLLDALRANPGGVPVGGGSAGGTDHILLGLILKALGRNGREGAYVAFAGGGPAQAALLGAQVAAGISGASEFIEQVRSGRLRALATSSEARILPDVPTLKESGVDVVLGNWRGLFGMPQITPQQRAALVQFATSVHASEAWKETLRTQGWQDAFMTGETFDNFLRRDIADTETVLREIGLVT
jgi:putative tricarboxylic transport membrane protein